MKSKTLSVVMSAAGLAGLAATSYGQGIVWFDNYACTPYYPIIYGSTLQGVQPSLAGTLAGANVNAELGYFIGTYVPGDLFTLIPSSLTAVNPVLAGGGYFQGPVVTIPNYVSGPITFEILAWTGPAMNAAYYYNFYNPTIWTEPSIATAPSPAGFFTDLPGNIIIISGPEPSTLAVAGLGALISLVAFRRRHS